LTRANNALACSEKTGRLFGFSFFLGSIVPFFITNKKPAATIVICYTHNHTNTLIIISEKKVNFSVTPRLAIAKK